MSSYYDDFINAFPEYSGSKMIEKAFDFAEKAHKGQLRKSGEEYFIHPCAVVRILAELNLDEASIVAGLLHDVIEDTEYTFADIEAEFSLEVAKIVDGVTKLTNFAFKSKEEQQAESIRKMLLAMANDIRVIIIKLADRLHNMRTLNYQSENKQYEKAHETLEIYAPLAHRLGISTIKCELEDLSLKFIDPYAYIDISTKLNATREERQKYIDEIIANIRSKMNELSINTVIEGRLKHIYSIYRKMNSKDKTFNELYDLVAVRIIVDSLKDCYGALGAVHTIWKPLPMRFKDYIAVPKSNMYQSLHTTVLGDDGKPFEVQIRTHEMHKTAEYGIAAHWKYKEGRQHSNDLDSKLSWLRELMEWQTELKDSKEFMEAFKFDIFTDHVFVFTPQGDIKDFVAGSTPVDFAYKVHSDVGNKCTGAKVNGKIVPLTYQLQTGDIVSIITSSNSKGPSRDWLNFVKTPQARNKIRLWFKKQLKAENISKGKDMLEKEVKHRGYDLAELLKTDYTDILLKKLSLNSVDDMFASLGYGGITVNQVALKLIENYKSRNKTPDDAPIKLTPSKKTGSGDIKVMGESGMVVRLAQCCHPIPGDKIVGYITRGRGVSVHRADCPNLGDIAFDPSRIVDVAWSGKDLSSYTAEIEVRAMDRPGMLLDISQLIFGLGLSIQSLNSRRLKNGKCIINFSIEIHELSEIDKLIEKIHTVRDVVDAYRVKA